MLADNGLQGLGDRRARGVPSARRDRRQFVLTVTLSPLEYLSGSKESENEMGAPRSRSAIDTRVSVVV